MNDLNDVQLLGATLFSETKDEDEAHGIANVIMKRTSRPNRFGKTVRDVVLAPSQFSGVGGNEWNKAVNNNLNEKEQKIYKKFLRLAYMATSGQLEDITGGADHYVNLKLAKPNWSSSYKKTARIGEHTFFQEPVSSPKKSKTPFAKAFSTAKAQGLDVFEWNGKQYTTETR